MDAASRFHVGITAINQKRTNLVEQSKYSTFRWFSDFYCYVCLVLFLF